MSPRLISFEGLARRSPIFTTPALQLAVARERVLKTLTLQSHLSMRISYKNIKKRLLPFGEGGDLKD